MNHAIVHIGPMKSGTSALARYLTVAQSRGELPGGVIYPIGELWFDRVRNIVKQEQEIMLLRKAARGDIAESDFVGIYRDFDAALAKVSAETKRSGDGTAVFICESAGKNTSVSALESWFAPHFDRVTFVTLARGQEFAMPSIVAQRVKEWVARDSSLNVADYLESETGFVRTIDYARMLEQWSRPGQPLVVIPYLEGEQGTMESIRRFFRVFGLGEPVEVRGIGGKRIHPTFSREGLEALGALKRRARRLRWLPGYYKRAEARFAELWKLYHASATQGGIEPSGGKFSAYSLDESDARLVRERFADSNRRLLSMVDRTGLESEWAQWERTAGLHSE